MCSNRGKKVNKQTNHPTTLKLIPQEAGIQSLYLNRSSYKSTGDANNPHYMRRGNSQPDLVSTRRSELRFAPTRETLGMHIVLVIPHKNKISTDLEYM